MTPGYQDKTYEQYKVDNTKSPKPQITLSHQEFDNLKDDADSYKALLVLQDNTESEMQIELRRLYQTIEERAKNRAYTAAQIITTQNFEIDTIDKIVAILKDHDNKQEKTRA